MIKKFSEGFIQDIADLMELCVENETDNVDLEFEFNGEKLQVSFLFAVKEVE